MCIRAAQVGCGVALLPRFLVEEELAEGKLVIPWQHAMPSQDAYYLAYPEHSAEVPKVRGCGTVHPTDCLRQYFLP